MKCFIHAAPLQGLTDYRFRNSFAQLFSAVDYFYAPYIRLSSKKEIKKINIRDISPKNNVGNTLIPQVLTNNSEDFLLVAKHIEETGYKELNWNLGCPYPMVTKKGMGAGILNKPDAIVNLLERVCSATNLKLSIKMRLGNEHPNSILSILPKLNDFPLKNIIIHPRIGKQLYKGKVDLETFEKCLNLTQHEIIYNGDIKSVNDYRLLCKRLPQISHWMLGRGLIADPLLPKMIKLNSDEYPENRYRLLLKMHDLLLYEYEKVRSGDAQIIMKMNEFWKYWSYNFQEANKPVKKIEKAKSLSKYNQAVVELFGEYLN